MNHKISTIAILVLIFLVGIAVIEAAFTSRSGWTFEQRGTNKVAINPLYFEIENASNNLTATLGGLFYLNQQLCTAENALCIISDANLSSSEGLAIRISIDNNITKVRSEIESNFSQLIINGSDVNFGFINASTLNATLIYGNYTGNIQCDKITGGPDTDFCTDGGGTGADVNGTDISIKTINATNMNATRNSYTNNLTVDNAINNGNNDMRILFESNKIIIVLE